jgi:PBP1b-binding outer membrane lipoprotein LpoB
MLSMAALLLLATILVLICAGCGSEQAPAETNEPAPRFTVENVTISGFGVAKIITDTETGVQYLYYRSDSGGGLTVLLPAEEAPHG